MLVLSRKINETIVIDGVVTVYVVDVRDDTVRLGIKAPKEIAIHRGEIQKIVEAKEIGNVKP